MQQALHPHYDLPTGLNAAFDALLAQRIGEASRVLHATLAPLPWNDPHREVLASLLGSVSTCVSHEDVTSALIGIYTLVEHLGSEPEPAQHAV